MNNHDEKEEWRVIAEFPNYEVSDLGRVRSWAPQYNGAARLNEPMSIAIQRRGLAYPSVRLSNEGKSRGRQVHILVAKAFCTPLSPNHTIVRHDDGDEQNCRATNLIWGTLSQNREDQFRHGRACFGEKSPRAKLTDVQAREIFESAETCPSLALKYGVAPATISSIRTGKTRKRSSHDGQSPGALGIGGRHRPMKITADDARFIFLSTEKHADLAAKYNLSIPTIHYIQIRKKWRLATEGLVAPERPHRSSGPWKEGRIAPLKRLTPEIIRDIFMSPLNGRDAALKFDVLESHISQIRSGKTCTDYTNGLIAPERLKPVKLDAEKARQIFVLPGSLREVAAKFDVSFAMVSLIRRRCAWAHATKDLPDVSPAR